MYTDMDIEERLCYISQLSNDDLKEGEGIKSKNVKNAKKLYDKYMLVKGILEESYYEAVNKVCQWYTDHGKKHIESIISTASDMIKYQYNQFNELELYIFLSSVIWHDVGMVQERKVHEEISINEMEKFDNIYSTDLEIMKAITKIVKSHTGAYGFESLDTAELIQYEGVTYKVNVRALAAILRLADEISETKTRIIPKLIDNGDVPEENLIYWEFANTVGLSYPNVKEHSINLKISINKCKILKKYMYTDDKIPHEGNEIELIDFILWRIDKINKERIMCSPEIRQYCSLNSLDITISILDGYNEVQPTNIKLDEKYLVESQSCFPEAFYDKEADWRKDRIKEII